MPPSASLHSTLTVTVCVYHPSESVVAACVEKTAQCGFLTFVSSFLCEQGDDQPKRGQCCDEHHLRLILFPYTAAASGLTSRPGRLVCGCQSTAASVATAATTNRSGSFRVATTAAAVLAKERHELDKREVDFDRRQRFVGRQ